MGEASVDTAVDCCSEYQKDLNELRDKLKEIEASMQDGKLLDEAGNASGGQELVVPLLKRCLLFTEIVEQKQGKIDERFKETYDKLIEIRNHLERLTMTQAWSLRETDLYMWQRKLDRIDDSRRDGNFFDAEGHPADLHAQRVSAPRPISKTHADCCRLYFTSYVVAMHTFISS